MNINEAYKQGREDGAEQANLRHAAERAHDRYRADGMWVVIIALSFLMKLILADSLTTLGVVLAFWGILLTVFVLFALRDRRTWQERRKAAVKGGMTEEEDA